MFNGAVKWELIEYNPLRKVDAPKFKRKRGNYYDLEQLRALLLAIDENNVESKYRVSVYIAVYCGLRVGEVLGLEWKDIDFEKMLITIRRSSVYAAGEVITKEPKNESSIRNIYFGEALKIELLKHKEVQDTLSSVVPGWTETDRLLTKKEGGPMFPQSVGQWFTKFIKRHNLDKITFHGLRHYVESLIMVSHFIKSTNKAT